MGAVIQRDLGLDPGPLEGLGVFPDCKSDRTARVQALRESHETGACFAKRRVLRNTLIPVPKLPSRFHQTCRHGRNNLLLGLLQRAKAASVGLQRSKETAPVRGAN